MPMFEPNWQPSKILSDSIPSSIRSYVLDPGSTTQYMRVHNIESKIKLIFSDWQQPFPAEATALNISTGDSVFVREVEIWCNDELWMFARTVIPQSAAVGYMSQICNLGERPLGDVIFQNATTSRSPFEIACLNSAHYLFQKTVNIMSSEQDELWARRSMLHVADERMLLSEVFTPIFGKL